MKEDKICVVCGNKYKYCQSCPQKYNVTETWRNIFCSENCRELYHVYDQIKAGQITDKNAAKALKKLDISNMSALNEPMKSVLLIAFNSTKKSEEQIVPDNINISDGADFSKPVNMKPKSRIKRK